MLNTQELVADDNVVQMRTLKRSLATNPTVDLGVRNWIEDRIKRAKEENTLIAEVQMMTPQLGRELLAGDDRNRPIRAAKLAQYRSALANDKWALNGESVIIGEDGTLYDGQHRAQASVDTGKSFLSVFVFGASAASRLTLDSGAYRSPGDHLQFAGVKFATAVAGIARWILAFENKTIGAFGATSRISAADVIERGIADTDLQNIAAFIYTLNVRKTKRLAPPSVLGFCLYEMKKKSAADAYRFMDSIVRGVNLDDHHPAYVAREQLMALENVSRETRIELLFRAWNAFRIGAEMPAGPAKGGKLPALK